MAGDRAEESRDGLSADQLTRFRFRFLDTDSELTGYYLACNGSELVAHSLPFNQRRNAGFLDGGHMNEYILASAVGPYEAVTLKLIEPDYESVSQSSSGIRMI